MGDPLRVLVVEDQPADQALLRAFLTRSLRPRFTVEFADRMATALDRVASDPFDAVLLDLLLPDARDLDGLRALRRAAPDLPVLVLTGNSDEAMGLAAIQQGAQDYVVKGERHSALLVRSIQWAVERQEAQRRLAESEAWHRRLVETAHDGIWVVDARGSTTAVNPRMARLLGLHAKDVVGRPLPAFVAEEDRPVLEAALGSPPSPDATTMGVALRRPDGTCLRTLFALRPVLDAAGTRTGTLAMVSDVTDRHRLEEALRDKNRLLEAQNARLRDASQHKSAFLSSVSHELRTPLNAIVGFAELLRDGQGGPVNELQGEWLDTMLAQANHLVRTIEDVMDLARLETGRLRVASTPVDVAALLDDVLAAVRSEADERGVTLSARVGEGLGCPRLDPVRTRQVLLHYLSNAVKFTPRGGRATASASRRDGWLRFEVADTGIGIRPEDLPLLFQEFSQVDSGPKRRYGGTGLGLAMTKRIVEALGGSVGVSSRPSEGSVFWATLPLTEAGAQSNAPAA